MTGLSILIPAALLMGLLGLAAFLWAMRSGQYDDLDGAAQRILIDDDQKEPFVNLPIAFPAIERTLSETETPSPAEKICPSNN